MTAKKIALLGASALAALALAGPAQALAAPALTLESSHYPQVVPSGTYAQYKLKLTNSGDEKVSAKVTVTFTAPTGLQVSSASGESITLFGSTVEPWTCTIAPDSQSATCTGVPSGQRPLPGQEACPNTGGCRILIVVKPDPALPVGSTLTPTVTACGGGASTCPTVAATAPADPLQIGPAPLFELTSFDGEALKQDGEPATQAGSRPYSASTSFFLSSFVGASGVESSSEQLQDTIVKLPPGLVGNPRAVPTCPQADHASAGQCPPESQVGTVTLWFRGLGTEPGHPQPVLLPVYNMERPEANAASPIGTPIVLAFNFAGNVIEVYAKLRSGEDYGATVIVKNAPQTISVGGTTFTVWGVPADPSHDEERFCHDSNVGPGECSSSASPKPFFTLPTSCEGPVRTSLTVTSWQGSSASSSFLSHMPGEPLNTIGADGCNAVDFSPSLEARPTTNVADSPSGLDVDLHIPQHEACDPGPPVSCENAEANLKDTTVTLPEGMVINPSGANGLGACTEAQFGFTAKEGDTIHTTPDPATCPDAAKLGTVEVDSPLLDHPMQGAAYIAQPYANPFNSLLALYITLDDPATGIVVKLAGEVKANPTTGRLTTTVLHNPQLPFEDFKLHFFGGAGGSLRTPAVCGTYATTSNLVPWTAPEGLPASPSDAWQISQGANGAGCPSSAAALPNSPSLDAGTISPIAGAYSPLVINLRREDGTQQFSTVTITPPPGLLGKLAGIPYCSEAALAAAAQKTGQEERQSPSCPAASEIGTVDVAAGAGPAPYWAHGTAYLTGPYKGAPIGLAIVTPAVAGPFDLGTVVVRTALLIDPVTAQITAVSDPIPAILQGIPLDVRQALIRLDKPSFTLNPTSCDPLAFSGSLLSTLNQAAPLSERFQVGECGRLGFKPKLSLRLKGGTKRGRYPALTAVLAPRAGDANLASISVALPHSEFLAQEHIRTVCTRVQFAADQCPEAAIYGTATVTTPLLDYPLSGPVYLRSSDNPLPDLVPDLRGPANQPIKLEAAGRTDSIKGGIRNTFDLVPDAPFTKLVLQLQGGKKGLLVNSRNICKEVNKATVKYAAHNGLTLEAHPALKARCGKKGKKGKKGTRKHHRHPAKRRARRDAR